MGITRSGIRVRLVKECALSYPSPTMKSGGLARPLFIGVSIRIYVLRLWYVLRSLAAALQAQYARRAGPIGLTVEELDFEHFPVKNGYPGIPVKAWIRFPNCAELVDGEVFAWTAKAAEVTWKDGPVTYRTWVWSSAVTRREEMMNRNLGERTRGKNSK